MGRETKKNNEIYEQLQWLYQNDDVGICNRLLVEMGIFKKKKRKTSEKSFFDDSQIDEDKRE